MHFLLLSDVMPNANCTGGEVVLYRHLEERKFMDFQIIDPSTIKPKKSWKIWINTFFTYLEKTRLRKWVLPFKFLYDLYDWDKSLIQTLKKNKPAFILTVAHGRGCFKALSLSQKIETPLVTIFHDFYPASIISDKVSRIFWVWETKHLYRNSDLTFVITEAMLRKLGKHTNVYILPPIPSGFMPPNLSMSSDHNRNIIFYAGLCGGAYYSMLHNMLMAVKTLKNCQLHIAGAESTRFRNFTDSQIFVHGFVDEKKLNELLSHANFLLVLIPFYRAREHFSTHFPSKLIEYAKYRKPIIIWGPAYSTAVRWGVDNSSAFVITHDKLQELHEEIESFISNPKLQITIADNAYQYYEKHWRPEMIHQIFTSKIKHLVKANL